MNNPDICRYERELGKAVRGIRCRKMVQEGFRESLKPLLEEVDSPVYDDLEKAFGPPEQMAQELIGTIPNLPMPLSIKQKAGIVVCFCVVIVGVCLGVLYLWNVPEISTTEPNMVMYEDDALNSEYVLCLDTEFNRSDLSWKQDKGSKEYLLLFKNSNQVDTLVSVNYSSRQPAHTIVVPAGEQRILQVENARATEHTISFDTADGSMSGSVQVLMHLPT